MKFCYIFLLTLFFYPPIFAQTNYYVSTSGNNSNNGTSIAQAWRTVQYAMNNATPNSIVNIRTGTYNEKVEVNVSGNVGSPIIFQNYNNEVVTISGTGISNPDAIIGIFDQSNIIVQGLTVANNQQLDAQGIIVEGDCENIEIRNNEIFNINFSTNPNAVANPSRNSQPLIVYGSNASNPVTNLIIDGNIVRDSRTGYSEGLAVNGNVNGFEVTNNTVHDIANIGIDVIGHEGTASANDQARNGIVKNNLVYDCKSPYATAAGIYVDGGKDLVIENNTVYECQWGIEVGCENIGKTTSNVKVRNNVIYDNDDSALAIGGFDFPSGSGKVIDCLFTNNSCYNNDKNNGGIGEVTGEFNISYTENCTIENNIFYATNSSDLMLFVYDVNSINLSLNYNLYYMVGGVEFEYEGTIYTSLASFKAGTGQDANSLFTNPQFVNTSAPDLHLMATSPAKDRGNPSFSPASGETDIDGESRVQNSRVDIGADEFAANTCAPMLNLSGTLASQTYQSSGTITSDGNVPNGTTTIFEAASIRLTDGFTVEDGGIFTAKIMPCAAFNQNESFSISEQETLSSPRLEATLEIYPNPASSNFTLRGDFLNNKISIWNSRGELVYLLPVAIQNTIAINLSDKGIYFVEIASEEGVVIRKVVVQ